MLVWIEMTVVAIVDIDDVDFHRDFSLKEFHFIVVPLLYSLRDLLGNLLLLMACKATIILVPCNSYII